jgi:hypothetical protein
MDCKSKGVVNTTYIIEGVESACNGFSTNIILSCSGNTSINLSTDELIFNGSIIPLIDNTFVIGSESNRFNNINTISGLSDYWVSNIGITTNNLIISGSGIYNGFAIGDNDNEIINWSSLTAYTTTSDKYVTGGTYDNNTALITFVGSNNFEPFSVDLSSIDVNDTFVTGGTISYDSNNLNGTLILNRNDGNSIIISGFTDINTTGSTLINNIVYFDTNESLSAYTLDLSSLDVNDTYSTGGTVTQFANNNSNEQIIQITGDDGFAPYNITGLTDTFITGFTFTPDTLTISQNNGIDLSTNIDNFYVTGGTYNSLTESIDFVGNNPVTTFNVDVSALLDDTNTFTTGATLSGNTILFDRNDLNNAYSVDLTPILPEIPTNLTFFSTTANSDVVGYSKLVISLDDPDYNTIPVNVSTGPITTQGQLIASLVSDAGIFAGNPGVINITTIGEIRRTSGSGVAEFYYEVYQRNNLGVETLIAISNKTTPVTTSVYQQFQASALFNNGTWLSTDRVVIKYYGERISGGSNPTYEFLFGGTNPVRTLFPISAQLLLNVPITIGITGIVSGTTNYLLSVDSNGKLGQVNPNIFTDNNISGGTVSYDSNDLNGTLILNKNDGNSIIISGFTDVQTTGATLVNSIAYFDTNESLSAYTLDLSSLDVNDTFVTGYTYNPNSNTLSILQNEGVPPINVTINSMSGLTINGNLTITGTTSISTITPRSTAASIFLTTEGNEVRSRTAAEVLTDIGAQTALTNPVTGTGTSGQVSFWTGTNTQSGDSGLIWDNVNKRFGIGATPNSGVLLDVRAQGALSTDTVFRVRDNADNNNIISVLGDGVLQHTSTFISRVSSTTNVYSFPTILGETFKMMYSVKFGTDLRGGEYICVQNGTTINTIHTFPTEFGDTSGIDFTFSISGGNIVVTANVTTGQWNIKLNIQIL